MNRVHGTEPFLRSRQLCSHSRTSQHFMEPEGSLPCSQEPSTSIVLRPPLSKSFINHSTIRHYEIYTIKCHKNIWSLFKRWKRIWFIYSRKGSEHSPRGQYLPLHVTFIGAVTCHWLDWTTLMTPRNLMQDAWHDWDSHWTELKKHA
jgi:hypothetical protein